MNAVTPVAPTTAALVQAVPAKKIGAAIRRLREAKNITQQDFADMLRINRSAVAQWETGRTNPTTGRLEQVAQALGVSISTIFTE